MSLHPVILCGGPGARLWPASTADRPKPFLDLIGGESLFLRTVRRVGDIAGAAPPLVVTGRAHAPLALAQLAAIGAAGRVLAEPQARDSAPAVLAAALLLAREDPEAVVLMTAADHHIPDARAFAEAVERALEAARAGAIVAFGLRPRAPATGFGYIAAGDPLDEAAGGAGVRRISAFIEKPDEARARELIAAGALWNSGNFLFRADVLIAEAQRLTPGLVEPVREALPAMGAADRPLVLSAGFGEALKISIDHAVMEKTDRAAVAPIDYDWSDLGAWNAVFAAASKDDAGIARFGEAAAVQSRDSLVRAEGGARVLAVGVSDLAIVARGSDVLVTRLDAAEGLKAALTALPPPTSPPSPPQPAQDLAGAARNLSHWFRRAALPLWLSFGADRARGGWHDRLDARLAPAADQPRRARVQARQAFVYAAAGASGWPGPWREAVEHGLTALDADFRRPDGLYRAADGDDRAFLYDQAFVLLALATAAGARPDAKETLEARALALLARIEAAFALDDGAFAADEPRTRRLSDPLMHLYEAALAWLAAGAGEPWRALAAALAQHLRTRLITEGTVREAYGPGWRALSSPDEPDIEPGHQFEWAWLTARHGELGGAADAGSLARALFARGEAGVREGLAVDGLARSGEVSHAGARLWPQTERLRAALRLGDEAAALEAAEALVRYFQDAPAGLWGDAPSPAATDAAPASSFYHLAGAIRALEETVLGL